MTVKSNEAQTENLASNAQKPNRMNKQSIIEFLNDNPEFLDNHADDIHALSEGQTETLSFQQKKLEKLDEQNRQLQKDLTEVLTEAKNNEILLDKIMQLTLSLMKSRDLAELINTSTQELAKHFDIDAVKFFLFCEPGQPANATFLKDSKSLKEGLDIYFPQSTPVVGRLDKSAKYSLFGMDSEALQSFAVIPLGDDAQLGILALGSKDSHRFISGMGTLFLEMIGSVICNLLQGYDA